MPTEELGKKWVCLLEIQILHTAGTRYLCSARTEGVSGEKLHQKVTLNHEEANGAGGRTS